MNQLIKIKEDEIARSNPGTIDVWGTVSVDEGSTISFIKVNNLDATHSGGYFAKDDISLNAVSSQEIVAVVQDSRGYITTNTVTVYFDETADIAFAYDLRGNMVYKSDKGEETLYIYDQRNYLKEARLPNHDMVRIETDSLGRRLKREFYNASEQTWEVQYYLLENIDTIADFDGSWIMEAYYVNHPAVDQIAIMDKGEIEYYFITDHLGSVRLAIDSNGDIKEQYEYSPYGDLTIKDQYGTALSNSAIGNRYTYTGREWDEDLKLYYYRARWYDPENKQFLSRSDYTPDIENPYLYVESNPVNYIDPLGEDTYVLGGNPTWTPGPGWLSVHFTPKESMYSCSKRVKHEVESSGLGNDPSNSINGHKYLHCVTACAISLECGVSAGILGQTAYEIYTNPLWSSKNGWFYVPGFLRGNYKIKGLYIWLKDTPGDLKAGYYGSLASVFAKDRCNCQKLCEKTKDWGFYGPLTLLGYF